MTGFELETIGAPRAVSSLDTTALPPQVIHRLWVDLTSDGIGAHVRVPVVVAKGRRPGPVFGITAAVHGNELNGIPVIHRIFQRTDLSRLRGTLVAVIVVNVPGYLRQQRAFHDGTDLNRVMPGEADGTAGAVFSYRLMERIVRRFDYLVDLHTASFGRINSLYVRADLRHPVTTQMAYLQKPQIVLHDPRGSGTLRAACMSIGIPAITVEIRDPHRFQRETIRQSLVGLRSVLAEVGMISKRAVVPGQDPVVCARSYWLRTDRGGLLEVFPAITERVEKDQIVASQSNIFGDVVQQYRSPESGIVIGKSTNPVSETGSRILHLGIVATPGELERLQCSVGKETHHASEGS